MSFLNCNPKDNKFIHIVECKFKKKSNYKLDVIKK